jgi:hypothetical protein
MTMCHCSRCATVSQIIDLVTAHGEPVGENGRFVADGHG